MRAPETTSWHSASWQTRPAAQQPVYADPKALERIVAQISRLPPIVVSWEIEELRARLAAAQRGEAFLLQGGDCAETFVDCESDTIAKKLKILLQMSLVLVHGLKKPIIRVGRMAGQYALGKPRYDTLMLHHPSEHGLGEKDPPSPISPLRTRYWVDSR